MSGTRSHFPKAPATDALIVSHGQPSDPEAAEAALRLVANRVAVHLPGLTVSSATMAAPGALERAVEQASLPPLVFPFFMADGWFTRQALPQRLGGSGGRVLAPLGLDPSLPAVAGRALVAKARHLGWRPEDVSVIVAAHGARQSPNPARCTRAFAKALERLAPFARVSCGYLEEDPGLAVVAANTGEAALCLPFFAAGGEHVTGDVPEQLARAGFRGEVLPPIGQWPEVAELIARSILACQTEEVAA